MYCVYVKSGLVSFLVNRDVSEHLPLRVKSNTRRYNTLPCQ